MSSPYHIEFQTKWFSQAQELIRGRTSVWTHRIGANTCAFEFPVLLFKTVGGGGRPAMHCSLLMIHLLFSHSLASSQLSFPFLQLQKEILVRTEGGLCAMHVCAMHPVVLPVLWNLVLVSLLHPHPSVSSSVSSSPSVLSSSPSRLF